MQHSLLKNTYNIKSTQKIQPGLVASYDIQPGNKVPVFW